MQINWMGDQCKEPIFHHIAPSATVAFTIVLSVPLNSLQAVINLLKRELSPHNDALTRTGEAMHLAAKSFRLAGRCRHGSCALRCSLIRERER
jgi:hypothetical protein